MARARTVRGSRTAAAQRAFTRIMVAVASPEDAEKPLNLALDLAALNHAELEIVHVAQPPLPLVPPFGGGVPMAVPSSYFTGVEEEEKRVARWMARVTWLAEEKGVRSQSRTLPNEGSVADQLTRMAEQQEVDLIITGIAERGRMARALMGSVSSEVTRKAKCPVLVVP